MDNITDTKDGFTITTDRSQMDIRAIHAYLCHEAYWSLGIPYDRVKAALENSLNFAILQDEKLIGYARIISDFSTIAYLGDVFILPEYRGRGLSRWMMEHIMSHPQLQGLRRWILATKDAHGLYEKFGWTPIAKPDRFMERFDPDVYKTR